MATTPFLAITLENQTRDLAPLAATVEVEDHDRLVDEARLTVRDPDGNGAALFEDGRTLKVEMGWDEEHAVLFDGVVVERRPVAAADGRRTLTVVARDLSHRMSREPRTCTYPAGPLSSIVTAVASRNGWTGDSARISCDPDPEIAERQTPLQQNMTDYQFLQRLAERYGARAFVEYNDGRSLFYFVSNRKLLEAKALGRLEYCRGLNKLIEFRYQSVAPRAARQVVATAVDPVTGEARTTQGQPPPTPAPTAGVAAPTPTAQPATALAAGLPSDPARAEHITIVDPTRVLGLRGEGRAIGTVMLRAKGKVEIVGLAPWAEGDWYVERALHTWRDTTVGTKRSASYETGFKATR